MHQNSFVEKAVINVDGFLENMVSIYKRDKAFLKTAEESATKSGDKRDLDHGRHQKAGNAKANVSKMKIQ